MRTRRLIAAAAVVAATLVSMMVGAGVAEAADPGGQNGYANAQASGGQLTVQAGHTYWTPPSGSSWATTAQSDPPPGKPNPNQPYGCTYQADPAAPLARCRRDGVVGQAAMSYSWMMPPSRSRRVIAPLVGGVAGRGIGW